MALWFSAEHTHHPSSLPPFVPIIDKKMKKLRPPSFVNRMPRKVSEFCHWKASELMSFLLVYSLPILEGIMSKKYFQHHVLLVYAITLLNLESVSEENIETAHRLLRKYVSTFVVLYGEKYTTCNIHLLLHLPENVIKFGPLWAFTCFPYEDFNGVLKS